MKWKKVVPMIVLVIILAVGASSAFASPKRVFVAPLSGAEEVALEEVETLARGQAFFQINEDGTELSYRLIVANIENVAAAHIHLAPAGVNGPVVVFLYGPGPINGRFSGVLAEGTITASDLVGQLAGDPLSDLMDEIMAGNAYVNVHTAQYPAGEIRGQIR
jgi:hypothetical protein